MDFVKICFGFLHVHRVLDDLVDSIRFIRRLCLRAVNGFDYKLFSMASMLFLFWCRVKLFLLLRNIVLYANWLKNGTSLLAVSLWFWIPNDVTDYTFPLTIRSKFLWFKEFLLWGRFWQTMWEMSRASD